MFGNRRTSLMIVLGVILLAAGLRLGGLGTSPPGLHHDEASNGYDGYSLLKTGADRWGVHWPLFLEAFGPRDHRPAFYAYLVAPCEAVLGPLRLALATRVPAALFGVMTVGVLFAAAARGFSLGVGVWAALFLAISPWHLQISRFGHESSLTPTFALLPIACLILAMPRRNAGDGDTGRLSVFWLTAAGVAWGVSLNTYASMRPFTPLMILGVVVLFRRDWVRSWGQPQGRRALCVAAVVGTVAAAPFLLATVTHWDQVMARAEQVSVLHSLPIGEAVTTAASQYAAHFAPDWLLIHGDRYAIQSPPGFGQLNAVVMLQAMVGAVVAFRDRNRNRFALLLLWWLAVHPLAAALTDGGPHALRSACGLPVFQWLAAIAADRLISQLRTRALRTTAIVLLLAVWGANAGFIVRDYFARWSRDPWVNALYQRDLCEAVRFIRPIVHEYDLVYVSDQNNRERRWYSGEAYAIVLVELPVAPADFQSWEKQVEVEPSGFHRVGAFGPFIMTTRSDVLAKSFRAWPDQKALLLVRPGEIGGGRLLGSVRDAAGETRFEIVEIVPPSPAR